MAEEVQDANTPESSAGDLEGAIASSPEAIEEAQEQVAQPPTAEQGETQKPEPEKAEPPFHEHPRWKEVQQEKEWYRQQLEKMMQQTPPAQPATTPQPAQDPYAGMAPEEKVFWMKQREIAREEAEKVLQQQVAPQLTQGIQEIARLRVDQFRRQHTDVKPDSPEEMQISQKIRQGYLPEDAYRAVMWDKKVEEKQVVTNQEQKQLLNQKRKASVVSPQSVSQQSQPAAKLSFEDELRQRMNTDWDGTI